MYFGSAVRPLQKFPQSLSDVQDQISSQSSKNERLVSDYSYVMSEQFPLSGFGWARWDKLLNLKMFRVRRPQVSSVWNGLNAETTHVVSRSSLKGSSPCPSLFFPPSSLRSTVNPPPSAFNSQVCFFTLGEFFCRCWEKKNHRKKKKKKCPHVSFRSHTKIAIFQKRTPQPESRRERGMKTCGCKSATDWISWLRWMTGICSFVSWFSAVTEWAFSPCPDCRPLRLSKTEATASIQDGLGRHDSSISGRKSI